MKSNFKIFALATLGAAGLVWVGCTTQIAPFGAYNPAASNPALVSNFESGLLKENVLLYEVGKPSNHVVTAGSFAAGYFDPLLATGTVVIASPGANGSSKACHLSGTIDDPETSPGGYDSLSITDPVEMSGGLYNASFFTGIQFYIKVSSSDNAASRQFTMPIDQTQPPPAPGVCGTGAYPNLTHCYDDFLFDYTSIARDQWVLFRLNFSDMKQGGYGSPVNPPDLNSHLDKIMYLTWSEGNAAQATHFIMDFWLDDVEFF